MSNVTRCSLCDCILSLGEYDFTGHTPDLCQRGTVDRIAFLTKMYQESQRDVAILRDMMARHECAALAPAVPTTREEKP